MNLTSDDFSFIKGIPVEFLERMKSMLSNEYFDFVKTYSKPIKKSIRFNSKKLREFDGNFKSIFKYALEPIVWDDLGYFYEGPLEDLTSHPYYYAGMYYLQEASAMSVVNYMDLQRGMRVLDLCSAPGGKTLQISEKIGDEGLLLSNDISASRQRATIRNIEKFGLKNVIVSCEEPKNIARNFKGFFDAILVDAPCSGEGIFSKNLKYAEEWRPDSPDRFSAIQKELLKTISPSLKNGGTLTYSTCTFSYEENEGVIEDFLSNNPDYKIVPIDMGLDVDTSGFIPGTVRLLPHRIKGLGHFFSKMKKFPETENTPFEKTKYIELDYSDKRYLTPDLGGKEIGLRILRSGLLLGKKGRHKFVNSQAMAMSLGNSYNGIKLNLSINEDDVFRYLRGETLLRKIDPGIVLVLVDSLPLGWANSDGKKIKNLYKKDWVRK